MCKGILFVSVTVESGCRWKTTSHDLICSWILHMLPLNLRKITLDFDQVFNAPHELDRY